MAPSQQHSSASANSTDFRNASRGFIAALEPCRIQNSNGRVIWDNDEYKFMHADCPPTANPKLWRQGQLCSKQGLFEVTYGIYQVRGFDISNITFVEGEKGIIVIDPLTSSECAEAAIKLYRQHRGQRSVTGLIYTHSHVDHFGGAKGVLPADPSNIPIIAPQGFMEEATSENVFAGPIMRRRAAYMYGNPLPKGPTGQIGFGLGMSVASGSVSLIPPNLIIHKTGEEHVIDGVRIIFQLVPNTEAPAEMNFYFPNHRALCIAECACHCLHNIITLRGALVRDAKAWSKYLDETLSLFGRRSDVLFASHNWPTWEEKNIVTFIEEQRDLYAYLHDQTVRMMNTGLNGTEIAEQIRLPKSLQTAWHAQGYYGSVSHNVKGIYQRYMTWFDGNPANLWKLPPAEEAKRYVECMGGTEQVIQKAKEFAQNRGDLRFAATLLDHAVSADSNNSAAKAALADVYEQLGFGAENGTWRNFYLTTAQDLRRGKQTLKGASAVLSLNPHAPVEDWFDGLSVQLDGIKADRVNLTIEVKLNEHDDRWRLNLSNGALTHRKISDDGRLERDPSFGLNCTKAELHKIMSGDSELVRLRGEGNPDCWNQLLHLCSVSEPTTKASSRL